MDLSDASSSKGRKPVLDPSVGCVEWRWGTSGIGLADFERLPSETGLSRGLSSCRRAFSSLSALKKRSSGDASRALFSLRRRAAFIMTGESSLLLEDDSESSVFIIAMAPVPFSANGRDREKNLGMGSDDGAGDAWNVGPAYAWVGGLFNLAGVIVLNCGYWWGERGDRVCVGVESKETSACELDVLLEGVC
jgi:hypothetical protein